MSTATLLAMVRKDLTLFISDRRAVLMGFVVPIAIASFFGSIFSGGGGSSEPTQVPVTLVDHDRSAISLEVVRRAKTDPAFSIEEAEETAARSAVQHGETTVAVVIPKGFGDASARAFFNGVDRPELTLWYDPSDSMQMMMVRGVLTQHVMGAVSAEVFGGPTGGRILDDQLATVDRTTLPEDQKESLRALLGSARDFYQRSQASNAAGGGRGGGRESGGGAGSGGGLTIPYTVRELPVTAGGQPYNGYAHSFAGMGVQFLFFAMIDLGVGILLERERGLWKRIRSAPISRLTLLAGKALSGSIIAFTTLLVSFAFAMLVFKVRIHGSVAGFFIIAAATAVMACTFGLLIAALGKTPGSTRGLASLAVLLMVMLGGAWVPTFVFPTWLQRLAVVVPARWAVDGLDAMTWRGLGFHAALLPVGVMLGFSALFGALAVARFRWDE